MSQEADKIEEAPALDIIREECSPILSSDDVMPPIVNEKEFRENLTSKPCTECGCLANNEQLKRKLNPEELEKLLHEREENLKVQFEERLAKEIALLKDRCEFILQNEQVRASYMLREAHRERQEKIFSLQSQLECKNLAGLMYVMCTERNKSKLEKLRITEKYTTYIHALQDILIEAQTLILHLSRGYKTAARVDNEWRNKMKKVLQEFQMFVHDFAKGTPESDQFFFDIPALLTTKAPVVDNPNQDPCEIEEEEEESRESSEILDEKKVVPPWFERMDEECHPFIMFGDMAEFNPPQRRKVLKTIKAAKTAPKKWKEYMFNDMFVKKDCDNADAIKDEYSKRMPSFTPWECGVGDRTASKTSFSSRRATSIDVRGNMGSILKIMTTTDVLKPQPRTALLGARDSMEIASTTKMREKHKQSDHNNKVVINIGSRRTSLFDNFGEENSEDGYRRPQSSEFIKYIVGPSKSPENDDDMNGVSRLGSLHHDSLQMIPTHIPDKDHKIHYEKVCPMEKCQRMQVDSFIRTLPPYMSANPFTHFEQTYDEYQPCTPEQIQVLKQRIEQKKLNEKAEIDLIEHDPLEEWSHGVCVGVQTSDISLDLPPCTCTVPSPSPAVSVPHIFRVADLIPVKQALDNIHKECFHDSRIEFDRFKVIGRDSDSSTQYYGNQTKKNKLQEITKVLKQHPSLLEIFQANT